LQYREQPSIISEQLADSMKEQEDLKRELEQQQEIGLPPALIPEQGKSPAQEVGNKKMSPEEQKAHEILNALGDVGASALQATTLLLMAENQGIFTDNLDINGVVTALQHECDARFNNPHIIGLFGPNPDLMKDQTKSVKGPSI